MSVKKNFLYNLSYQVLIMIMPLITTPYISRIIGPEGVGIQSYTLSIVNYFILFIMLGINNHGNRSIAMVRDDRKKLSKTFISIYSIQAIMSIIVTILYSVYIIFIADDYKQLFIIQYIYILAALLDINWFFFGLEKFKLTVTRNVVIKIISVFCIFIFIKDSSDLYKYCLILALGQFISQLILWKFLAKEIKITKVSIESILEQVKPILILFIPVIAISIYKIMDKIMIGSMSSVTQLGYYENSEKIINIPMGVITALATVMLPKMSNLQAKGKDKESIKYISMSIEFVMMMSFASIFGLIGISPILIPIFLGEKFIECIDIVSLLSITILFLSWANVIRTQYLIPRKKDKIYIYSTIFGAMTNFFINLVLIPKFGAAGAAIGTIFAEGVVAIYQTIMVRKELDIKSFMKKSIFYFIPGLIMCIVVRYLGSVLERSIITGLIQILVGAIIYCIISYIYLIISKHELGLLASRKFLNKLKLLTFS